jgi:hypothetical protein
VARERKGSLSTVSSGYLSPNRKLIFEPSFKVIS